MAKLDSHTHRVVKEARKAIAENMVGQSVNSPAGEIGTVLRCWVNHDLSVEAELSMGGNRTATTVILPAVPKPLPKAQ